MFDLYYFSFNVTDQVHQPDLPGILVSPPIKKGSHGRDGDLVVLYLSLTGKNSYTPDELNGMLQRAALAYYKSSGSLTAGMRAAAEVCSGQLVERNLKNARGEGGQAIGRLNIAVLREDTLFLAVAGPSHTYILGAEEVQDFYDPQGGRGLGAGSAVGLRYFQARMQVGDVLVFSPEPPTIWTPANLAGCGALTLEHLRRRLLNGIDPNLQAVVFKFQPGNGEVHALRHRSNAPQPAMTRPAQAALSAAPTGYLSEAPRSAPAESPAGRRSPSSTAIPTRPPASRPAHSTPTRPPAAPVTRGVPAEKPAAPPPEMEDRPARQAAALEAARLARQRRAERKQKAAAAWSGWKSFTARTSQGWHNLLVRLAPQRSSPTVAAPTNMHASPALLAFIAIAVPLVVVAISMTVYLQTGRSEQRTTYYQQAVQFADKAMAEKDLQLQRSDWDQVLSWLDKTEAYGASDESRALRKRAQQGMDVSDAVIRLDLRPVNRVGFANSVQVVRMVSNGDDLYMLDASNGTVLRLFLTAQGYELDTLFNCGPGPSGSIFIGALIDLAPMPAVNPNNATIAALDGNGNLLYCIPGKPPISRPLAPPNIGWGKIAGMALVQDSLFVLDVLGNAVWLYSGNNLIFQDRPRLFSENFNLTMADIVDLAFYEDNIYFLRKDGHMVECVLSKVQTIPTRCASPAKFNDNRPGREAKPDLMPDTQFTQFLSINAPDPSLYLLDASHAAIYRFSMTLNFQDQMRPSGTNDTPLPRSNPTAFTITPRRIAFLAYGSQVFMAQMP